MLRRIDRGWKFRQQPATHGRQHQLATKKQESQFIFLQPQCKKYTVRISTPTLLVLNTTLPILVIAVCCLVGAVRIEGDTTSNRGREMLLPDACVILTALRVVSDL